MINIQTITPSDKAYSKLNTSIEKQREDKIDYDLLAEVYNEAPERSLLLVKARAKMRLGNVARVLKGRGVVRGTDYDMYRVKEDATGAAIPPDKKPIAIKKLSSAKMRW